MEFRVGIWHAVLGSQASAADLVCCALSAALLASATEFRGSFGKRIEDRRSETTVPNGGPAIRSAPGVRARSYGF